jgi:uncharacterized protein YdhG (YjbR/CyaY superfamily)
MCFGKYTGAKINCFQAFNILKFYSIMQLTKSKAKINTVDDYLSELPDDVYLVLENIRQIIKFLVPDAEETISYQVPAYKFKGMLVGFGATKTHCSFFVMSSTLLKEFEEEVKDFDTSTGTIRFTPEKPVPNELITRIVMTRVAENETKSQKKSVGS